MNLKENQLSTNPSYRPCGDISGQFKVNHSHKQFSRQSTHFRSFTKSYMNPQVDEYLKTAKKWQAEMTKVRSILLSCPLTEEYKWDKPCYTFQDTNIVLMVGFKEHCALIVCKGALLKDPHNILIKPGENTQAARQLRFNNLADIVAKESILKDYMNEAIQVEKAGLKVDYAKSTELTFPEEFQIKLNELPALKAAFSALTPGRQRAYNMFFSAPKQTKTRTARVEKCLPQILGGKGLND